MGQEKNPSYIGGHSVQKYIYGCNNGSQSVQKHVEKFMANLTIFQTFSELHWRQSVQNHFPCYIGGQSVETYAYLLQLCRKFRSPTRPLLKPSAHQQAEHARHRLRRPALSGIGCSGINL